MKYYLILAILTIGLLLNACKSSESSKEDNKPQVVTTESGLQYIDLKLGDGEMPIIGQKVLVHYEGKFEDGTIFDSSRELKKPYEFTIGANEVIKGWDEGVQTMRVGGIRKLIIPPELGYGSRSVNKIPANSTLYIEVELIGIKK